MSVTATKVDVFVIREASGSLLLVTADAVAARAAMEPGDSCERQSVWIEDAS